MYNKRIPFLNLNYKKARKNFEFQPKSREMGSATFWYFNKS